MSDTTRRKPPSRYEQIIERIFRAHYTRPAEEFEFTRDEIVTTAQQLGIGLPKNLGDVLYTFRYRAPLPPYIAAAAPKGKSWTILPAGRGRYRFLAEVALKAEPNAALAETKVPDATPGVIAMYALGDEQALLAKLRYNRLIDVFTGVTCYSLQNHLRTNLPDFGQIETDEIYIGIDRRGAHYFFPVQAKAGKDRLASVQVRQDLWLSRARFPNLICRPIGANFMKKDLIALFEFEESGRDIKISAERHYRLVPPETLSPEELAAYRKRPE
jgi:hypothetical protein